MTEFAIVLQMARFTGTVQFLPGGGCAAQKMTPAAGITVVTVNTRGGVFLHMDRVVKGYIGPIFKIGIIVIHRFC